MARSADFNAALRAAQRAGCTVVRRKKHLVLVTPSGARVVASGSPSDVNAVRNFRRDLEKAGVTLEET